MHVALCSALWQRHDLAPIWWAGVRRIQQRFAGHGIPLSVTVAGSEPQHRKLAHQHGATWVAIENTPLGRKWNAAVESACLAGADFVLILGADDFLGDELIDQYAALIGDGWLYVGLGAIYCWEPATGRIGKVTLTEHPYGNPIGAGRLVHRSLLEAQKFRPWLDVLERRLDSDMRQRCNLPAARLIRVSNTAVALDVKTQANLWSFDRLAEGYGQCLERVSPAMRLPEWMPLYRALGKREVA